MGRPSCSYTDSVSGWMDGSSTQAECKASVSGWIIVAHRQINGFGQWVDHSSTQAEYNACLL